MHWRRTGPEGSRRRGWTLGRMEEAGRGRVVVEIRVVVRWDRESRRWDSDLWFRRARWWANWAVMDGALVLRDCWRMLMAVGSVVGG
jgi:hypothetical protein